MVEYGKKIISTLQKLPDSPGIYLFYSATKELIYVGKATSLRSRVRSYFRPPREPLLRKEGTIDLPFVRGGEVGSRPIEQMMHEVVDIKWRKTDSVLEAIILEAEYIKKFQPKYNVEGKDDKSWNYITISKDVYPKVETMREREYAVIARREERPTKSRDASGGQSPRFDDSSTGGIATSADANRLSRNDKYIFGPYPGLNTKAAIKLLRRMFRFSNCEPTRQRHLSPTLPPSSEGLRPAVGRGATTLPPPQGRRQEEDLGRPCLYRQMGWCPGVCTGEISATEYKRQVIRPLVTFLLGRKKQVIKIFEMEMKRAVRDERYEDAGRLRDQLKSLQRIQDIALLNKNFFDQGVIARKEERLTKSRDASGGQSPHFDDSSTGGIATSADANRLSRNDIRIEGYDISNLGASEKVGSMVVFNEEGPIKSEYRKFIIKTVPGQSDVDCLAEVIERRLKHLEWGVPDLMLIDGGRPQVNRVRRVLSGVKNLRIPQLSIVGIAKGKERKRNDFILNTDYTDFGKDYADSRRKKAELIAWVNKHQKLLIHVRDEAHRFAITFLRQRRSHQIPNIIKNRTR